MARKGKKGDKSSLVISIVVHVLALGGLAYVAHRAGFVPSAVYKITGIKPPEKPKPKPKPPEPKPDLPPPKQNEIVEETTTPPPANAAPPSGAPPTASTARSDAPPAAGGGANNFFRAEARKPDAAPVRPIQGKPGTGAGNLDANKSTASATATKSAFDEASTRPSTIATVLEERKSAAAAQEAISSEQIARSGGGDASQIATKITGVVATDNKQIVVRGLNDRYNVATLNGTELPSADPRRRAPQLDLIPSPMIDRIVVSKTFTPDLPGGFAGGAVNIVTKSFPAKSFTTLSLGTGVNTEASFNDGFQSTKGGGLDWLALDDGTRKLPQEALIDFNGLVRNAETPWRVNTEQAVGAERLQSAQQIDTALRSFKNTDFAPGMGQPGPNSTFTLSSGDTTWLFGKRVGWFGTLTHDRKFQFYNEAFRGRYAYGSDIYDGGPLTRTSEFLRDQSTIDVSWGAVASVAMEIMPGHELSVGFLHNQSAQQIAIEENGKTIDQFDPSATARSRIYQLSYRERFLQNLQFKGRHELRELGGSQLDWSYSMSSTAEDSPDERIFPLIYDETGSGSYNIIAQSAELPNINQPARFFRNSQDESRNFRADLTVPFTPGNGLESSIKIGVNGLQSERALRQEIFEYGVPQGTGVNQPDIAGYANSVLAFQQQTFVTNFTGTGANRRAAYVFPRTNPSFLRGGLPFDGYGYNGTQEIPAVYAMTDFFATSWLRLIGGARIERTDLEAEVLPRSRIIGGTTSGQIKTTDVLPSISAVFPITSNLNVRASWSETVARPTYREFAPFEYYDTADGLAYRGNASLDRTSIENYDARLEWFPRPGELFSVAYFHKNLKDPIEPFIADNANGIVSFTNNPTAIVRGVEFEARKNLGSLDPLLSPFTLGGNFAYIDSLVDVYYPSGNGIGLYQRPLFDQPEYILNADLTWELARSGTQVSVSFARSGQRLAVDGGQGSPNIYEQPIDTLDLFVSQRLGRWKMRFGARNLLDPDVKQILINDLGSSPDRYGDAYVFRSYRRGVTFSLTISTDF
jgi:outer membrane receptor protein involved in Fe transport